MASAVRTPRHQGRRPVNGRLAYDLGWEVRQQALEQAGKAVKAPPKVHAAPAVRVRERQYVSRLAVTGVAGVIVLALLVLASYVQLTMLSAETVKLHEQLTELETDHTILTAEYEQMFDMASVKEAAEAAGMGKPSATQVTHLDLSEGDSTVSYQEENPGFFRRLLNSLHGGVYAVVEYFD